MIRLLPALFLLRILLGLYEAAERVVADAQSDYTTPVQLLIQAAMGRSSQTATRFLQPVGQPY